MSGARNMLYRYPVAVVFGVASAVSLASFATNPSSIEPSCPFDGTFYCAAANGARIPAPYSRRPVVPLIARLLPGTLDARFRAIAVGCLLLAIALAIVLGDRIVKQLDADRHRGLRSPSSSPVPDSPDRMACGSRCRCRFSLTTRAWRPACSGSCCIRPGTARSLMLAVPAAFLACCTREVWGPVIIVAALSTLFVRRNVVGIAIASIVAALVAFVAMTWLVPSAPSSYDELDVVRGLWHIHFVDLEGLGQTVWSYVFALGLVPAILLYRPPWRWLWRRRAQGDTTAFTIVIAGSLLVGSALLGGVDLTRLAYPGGFLLIIFSAPWLVTQRDLAIPATVFAITTIVLWEPGRHLITSVPDYEAYYYPAARAYSGLAISAIALGVAGEVLLTGTHRNPPPTHSTVDHALRGSPASSWKGRRGR